MMGKDEILLPPCEWEKQGNVIVHDPDGWRFKVGNLKPQDYNIPISKQEFLARIISSTIQCNFKKFDKWSRRGY